MYFNDVMTLTFAGAPGMEAHIRRNIRSIDQEAEYERATRMHGDMWISRRPAQMRSATRWAANAKLGLAYVREAGLLENGRAIYIAQYARR